MQPALASLVRHTRIGAAVDEQLQTLEQLLVVLLLLFFAAHAVALAATMRQRAGHAHLAADLAYEHEQRRVAIAIARVQLVQREAGVEGEARDVTQAIAARRAVDDVQQRLMASGAVQKYVVGPPDGATVEQRATAALRTEEGGAEQRLAALVSVARALGEAAHEQRETGVGALVARVEQRV